MPTDVARLDLRLRRRSMAWYTAGMGVYALLIVVMYPTVASDTTLESLTSSNPDVMALLGVAGSLTSPVGWVSGNLYANFLPLIMLLLTVGYGASSLAGQSEDGTLGLVATLPITRRALLLQKASVLVLVALPLAAVTAACVVLGRHYDLDLAVGPLLATTAAVLLLGVDFGLLALLLGVVSGSRGLAVGVASAVAAASYLVGSLAPVANWAHSLRWASLFHWAVGGDQLSHGPTLTAWAVLLLVGAGLLGAALATVHRLDIR
ncbi:MAG: ABC transporter permease subunit [Angustibacter sp.]